MEDIRSETKRRYDHVCVHYEGRAMVMLNSKWGVVDLDGNEVVPLIYDSAGYYRKGRAIVQLDGKYGVVDLEGNEVIPCWYESVQRQSYGFITMYLVSYCDLKHLYFDKDGHPIAEPVIN
jgi:hypothetical protein